MEELKKQILNLTGKYDKLAQDVKNLKTKMKKDESTINSLQKELNQLKQSNPSSSSNGPRTIVNEAAVKINRANNYGKPQQQTQQQQQQPSDPLDMFFNASNNKQNAPIQNNGNKMIQNNGNTNNTNNNGNAFSAWESF